MPQVAPPSLAIVVAMAQNRTIGINNALPWRCPEDLKHFKALTMGHHIIMGRKTFESIGRPLPGRTTIVVSRNREFAPKDCIVAHSLEAAIAACGQDEFIFIVGGAELYAQALPLVDTLFITEMALAAEGDAHFPELNKNEWVETESRAGQQESPQRLNYNFKTYRKLEGPPNGSLAVKRFE